MAARPKHKYTINSLDRGLRILAILGENGDPGGVNEVSRRLGIDKSTTYRIMSTLRGQGFVDQDAETRKYLLGLKVIAVANLKLRGAKRSIRRSCSATILSRECGPAGRAQRQPTGLIGNPRFRNRRIRRWQ